MIAVATRDPSLKDIIASAPDGYKHGSGLWTNVSGKQKE
jgi:hypothetical protein